MTKILNPRAFRDCLFWISSLSRISGFGFRIWSEALPHQDYELGVMREQSLRPTGVDQPIAGCGRKGRGISSCPRGWRGVGVVPLVFGENVWG